MTDEEALKKYADLMIFYNGKSIPDPENEPIRFAHYVKLFNYYTQQKEIDLVAEPVETVI